MRVLVACEESQAVCKAFRERGHEAYSCDIQECSGGHPEWHIMGDAIEVAYSGGWDLMIAHPPCTYMCIAGAAHMYPRAGVVSDERLGLAFEARDFFMRLLSAPVARVAIENPTPLRIVGLPPCSQVVQPYMFGHPFSKRTCLWLRGLPQLLPTGLVADHVPFMASNAGGAKRGQKAVTIGARTQKARSKTFAGIAAAMADQWGRANADGCETITYKING